MERKFREFPIIDKPDYSKFIYWACQRWETVAFLTSSNHHKDKWSQCDAMLAAGTFEEICPSPDDDSFIKLKEFTDQNQDWAFGFLSYDLKNQIEELNSNNADYVEMPLLHFFVPEVLFIFRHGKIELGVRGNTAIENGVHEKIIDQVNNTLPVFIEASEFTIQHRTTRNDYISKVEQIKTHIKQGNIYEANFCMEFFCEHASIDPLGTFLKLNQINPSPFACFYKLRNKYLLSSSPERFLAKRNQTLLSQPIKGTIKRAIAPEKDFLQKEILKNDPKERSENIMIVDLVRNDLSHSAQKGSVKVTELCGIYSYATVHQMISTIECKLRHDVHFVDAIKMAFPMGSMTGAPKIRAMTLMEEFETTRRGLYSGAVGYISPCRDFDFNVIIRSILYNQESQYASIMAGSAITIGSIAEKEYEECLLKAQSMVKTLQDFNPIKTTK